MVDLDTHTCSVNCWVGKEVFAASGVIARAQPVRTVPTEGGQGACPRMSLSMLNPQAWATQAALAGSLLSIESSAACNTAAMWNSLYSSSVSN